MRNFILSFLALSLFLPFSWRNTNVAVNERPDLGIIILVKSNLFGYVSASWFGAIGDGVADDTAPIQQAINYAYEHKIGEVRILEGVYNVNISGHDKNGDPLIIDGESHYFDVIGAGLMLKSNVNLRLDKKATIKAIATDIPEYAVLYVGEQKDIRISGGRIVGDYASHKGTIGQHGMCIWIQSSSNIIIDGCDISQGWGDCIDIGCKWDSRIEPGSNKSHDISITNCSLHDSRRQGISVVGCDNLSVRNCHIYNIAGDAPQAGIDLEVNFVDYPNRDCVFDSVFVEKCTGGGIIGYTTPTHGVTIKNSLIQSVQLTCVDAVNIEHSIIAYVTLDNYYNVPNDTIKIKGTEIRTLTLYSCGYYNLTVDDCTIGKDKEQPAFAFVKRREGHSIQNAVNIQFLRSRLVADSNVHLFSISSSVFPNRLLLNDCTCTFYKPSTIFANEVGFYGCVLLGRSLTIDYNAAKVTMHNNTIDTRDCRENINGYMYKFLSNDSVVFSDNILLGEKKENQYLIIPKEYTPVCEIINNDAQQYTTMGSFHNQQNVRVANNRLKML